MPRRSAFTLFRRDLPGRSVQQARAYASPIWYTSWPMKTSQAVLGTMLIWQGCSPVFGQTPALERGGAYTADPARFEESIARFEAADREAAPPPGAILGLGSSSMRMWETIAEDLAPLTVVPRGFGGSNLNDALHYADRIVLPYKPRAIVLYEGDNDIAQGVAPEIIADTFRRFTRKVHGALPGCRIYFLSIKPSISRWNLWPAMTEANDLIAAACAKDARLTYVDVATGMLNDKGQPRPDIFKEDNLHMERAGYLIWRDALRPVLLAAERAFEPANPPPAE